MSDLFNYFYIVGVTIDSFLPYGFLRSRSSLGGSVERAREAKVSIIIFTHSISIELRGDYFNTTDPMKLINRATTLTVN